MNQTVICLGAHVFDVQLRPVDAIPDGQGVALVEQIRFSPAGAAGGRSLTLAKLGATARSAGAIGADPIVRAEHSDALTVPLYARNRAVAPSRTCLRLRAP